MPHTTAGAAIRQCKAHGHPRSCLDINMAQQQISSRPIPKLTAVSNCAGGLQGQGLGQLQQWAMDVFRVCLVSNEHANLKRTMSI
jgi:hypothetical protein